MSERPRVTQHLIERTEKQLRDAGLEPTPERVADWLIARKHLDTAEQVLEDAQRPKEKMSAEWWHAEADRYCRLHLKACRESVALEIQLRAMREHLERAFDVLRGRTEDGGA